MFERSKFNYLDNLITYCCDIFSILYYQEILISRQVGVGINS